MERKATRDSELLHTERGEMITEFGGVGGAVCNRRRLRRYLDVMFKSSDVFSPLECAAILYLAAERMCGWGSWKQKTFLWRQTKMLTKPSFFVSIVRFRAWNPSPTGENCWPPSFTRLSSSCGLGIANRVVLMVRTCLRLSLLKVRGTCCVRWLDFWGFGRSQHFGVRQTFTKDDTILLDSSWAKFLALIWTLLAKPRVRRPSFRTRTRVSVPVGAPYITRNSGPSIDRAANPRSGEEFWKRGTWAQDCSMAGKK